MCLRNICMVPCWPFQGRKFRRKIQCGAEMVLPPSWFRLDSWLNPSDFWVCKTAVDRFQAAVVPLSDFWGRFLGSLVRAHGLKFQLALISKSLLVPEKNKNCAYLKSLEIKILFHCKKKQCIPWNAHSKQLFAYKIKWIQCSSPKWAHLGWRPTIHSCHLWPSLCWPPRPDQARLQYHLGE